MAQCSERSADIANYIAFSIGRPAAVQIPAVFQFAAFVGERI
jgi:hypothetical protein